MQDPEKPVKVKGKDQIALDEEVARRLEAHMQAEFKEEERVARQIEEEANLISWDNTQAMMQAEVLEGSRKKAESSRKEEEIYTEGTRKYWKIIRVGNHTEVHHFFDDMLKALDRDDLVMLWSLIKENFNSTEPTYDKEREIWVELKRLFEPDTHAELWKPQKYIHDLTCRLYDLYGVYHVSIEKGIDIYMLVEKEYPLSKGTLTLMLVVKLLVNQDNEMSRELLRKIFMQAKRLRI
nr:hypothetical protein [Tanacetum cinerariifolium]